MAKKYIDAELLLKEVESRIRDCDANSKNPNQLLWAELSALIPFIDSLKQEQPSEDLEAEIEMQWDSFNKHLAEYDGESEDVVWLNWNSFVDVARQFYELGKQSKK